MPLAAGLLSWLLLADAQPPAGKLPPTCKPPGTRYNQVRQPSSHNSYDRCGVLPWPCSPKGSLEEQLNAGVRSLELDLHPKNTGLFWNEVAPAEWAVYHISNLRHGGDHCQSLSECLGQVKRWHDAHPAHEVITLWLQLAGDWDSQGHEPADLDANRLEKDLAEALLRPAELLAACPGAANLQQAVRGPCAWPALERLRSRIIVVLMGDNDREAAYLTTERARSCFVAPDIERDCPATLANWPDAVFFNIHNHDGLSLATCVFDAGLVSRVWGIDGANEWTAARTSRTQHLATDAVMSDVRPPRAVDACGQPFEVIAR